MTRTWNISILSAAAAAGLAAAAGAWALWPTPATLQLGDVGSYVFVPSRAAPQVTIIDTDVDQVVARLALDSIPNQILVSDAVGRLITSNLEARTVSILDLATRSVEAVVQLDIAPRSMVLSPDGWLVAVGDAVAGTAVVVSLHRQDVLARVDGLHEPSHMTFSDDGSVVYVTDRMTGEVKLIDIAGGGVIGDISVHSVADAGEISAVTRTPNGHYGFCALTGRKELAILDLNSEQRIKTLRLGTDPGRPYGTADGRYMMVANNGDRTVSVISTESLDVVATLPGAADVSAINTGWFESVAFVISAAEDKAVVLDLIELEKAGEIALPSRPGPGVVTADGTKMYVALSGSNQVAVIDTRERRLATLIDDAGDEPWGATMARTNNYCH